MSNWNSLEHLSDKDTALTLDMGSVYGLDIPA